jgi:ketosteroid isomerase-like protein
VSQENVEVVRGLQPGPDFDITQIVRDDDVNDAWVTVVAPFFHSDFECVMMSPTEGPRTYVGLRGLRTAWTDWTAPWAMYRSEVEQILDAGHRVVVLVRDFGRRQQSSREVAFRAAAVWTLRDAKIVRVEFYPDRHQALKAVGLEE